MKLSPLIIAGLVAGIFMPLFSHLPILNLVNCIPCGWIWLGGIVAVGLYRWITGEVEPMIASDGAILGIFTGVVAAFTSLIMAIFLLGIDPAPQPLVRLVPLLDRIRETFHFTHLKQTSYMLMFLFDLISFPLISAISGFVGIQLLGKSTSQTVAYQDSNSPTQIEQ